MARTVTLKMQNADGTYANCLTTTFRKHRTTFWFPYKTNDQQEIEYLLSRGAKIDYAKPKPIYRPPVLSTPTPLSEGGEDK